MGLRTQILFYNPGVIKLTVWSRAVPISDFHHRIMMARQIHDDYRHFGEKSSHQIYFYSVYSGLGLGLDNVCVGGRWGNNHKCQISIQDEQLLSTTQLLVKSKTYGRNINMCIIFIIF